MSQINPNKIVQMGILALCEHTMIQQVGVDLTLAETVEVKNGSSANVLLNEVVSLPNNIFATFTHRSSYNRRGILITGSVYDPGYCGRVGCTIYNLSGEGIKISINERIGQMVFFDADSASAYNGRWQGENL